MLIIVKPYDHLQITRYCLPSFKFEFPVFSFCDEVCCHPWVISKYLVAKPGENNCDYKKEEKLLSEVYD